MSTLPAHPDHIVVVIEENHSTAELLGSGQAPYMDSLAQQGAVIPGYHADAHPSEPNYFALFSGSTQGITDDGTYTITAHSLAGDLKAAGKTFVGYAENGSPQKHNPWQSFTDAQGTGADFSQFPTDFTKLPTVSFVSPNLQNDMHDGSIQQGDAWLRQNLDAYAQWAKTHNSELIVVADEDDSSQSNQVPAIVVGAGVPAGGTISGPTDHIGLFHAIESQALSSAAPPSASPPTVPAPPPSQSPPPTVAKPTSVTVPWNNIAITATTGDHMLFISGSGDQVKLSGGTNTIADTGRTNTYTIPTAGKGFDAFTTNILNNHDVLNLHAALAATNWPGSTNTLANYLKVTNTSSGGALLSISSTSGGSPVGIASIAGAANTSLSTLLAHSLT